MLFLWGIKIYAQYDLMNISTAKSMISRIIWGTDKDHLFWLEEHLKRNYTLFRSLNQTSYLLIAQNHRHHRVVTYFFRYVWLCLMYYCGCHSHFCFPSLLWTRRHHQLLEIFSWDWPAQGHHLSRQLISHAWGKPQ